MSDFARTPSGEPLPAVSIVTAAYNAESTLLETVDSVLAQTYTDWELVIVDDGSTDGTADLANGCAAADARIRVIAQENAGTAAARNAGFALARGGWWCFLDADDAMFPGYLERMTAFTDQNPGYDIYSCNAEVLLRGEGTELMWRGQQWRRAHEVTPLEQFAESSISPVSLFRPEVFDVTGGFRAVYSEDYDFWLRALLLGFRHLFNPEVLWRYRRREGSKTTALVQEAESILAILTDARGMAALTDAQRVECDRAIEFARARIGRRTLEESLLRGEYSGARGAYLRYRDAFPDKAKYALGFVLMMLSPGLYARIKSRRMV